MNLQAEQRAELALEAWRTRLDEKVAQYTEVELPEDQRTADGAKSYYFYEEWLTPCPCSCLGIAAPINKDIVEMCTTTRSRTSRAYFVDEVEEELLVLNVECENSCRCLSFF